MGGKGPDHSACHHPSIPVTPLVGFLFRVDKVLLGPMDLQARLQRQMGMAKGDQGGRVTQLQQNRAGRGEICPVEIRRPHSGIQ